MADIALIRRYEALRSLLTKVRDQLNDMSGNDEWEWGKRNEKADKLIAMIEDFL